MHIFEKDHQVIGALHELRRVWRLHNPRHSRQPAIRSRIVFGIMIYISGFSCFGVRDAALSGSDRVQLAGATFPALPRTGGHVGHERDIEEAAEVWLPLLRPWDLLRTRQAGDLTENRRCSQPTETNHPGHDTASTIAHVHGNLFSNTEYMSAAGGRADPFTSSLRILQPAISTLVPDEYRHYRVPPLLDTVKVRELTFLLQNQ